MSTFISRWTLRIGFRCFLLALVASAALPGRVTAADAPEVIEVRWADAVSGDWFDASLWVGGVVPNVVDATMYDAVLDAVGEPYTVALESSILLRRLVLDSMDVTLAQSSGTLTLLDALQINAGQFVFSGGVIQGGIHVASGGSFEITPGGQQRFDGVAFSGSDLVLEGGVALQITNGLQMNGGDVVLRNNSMIEFVGNQVISGFAIRRPEGMQSGGIRVAAFSEVILASDAMIELTGNGGIAIKEGAVFRNQGELHSVRVHDPTLFGAVNAGSFINEGLMTGGRLLASWWENHGEIELLTQVTGAGVNTGVIRNIASFASAWTNLGTLEVTSGSSSINSGWSNEGVAVVNEGAILRLLSPTQGEGRIELLGGTVLLGSAFSTSLLHQIDSFGGAIAVRGAWNNTSHVYVMPEGLQTLSLEADAVVTGGEIQISDSSNVRVHGGALDGVRVSGGDLLVQRIGSGEHRLTLRSSFSTDSNALVIRDAGIVQIDSDVSFDAGEIRLEASAGSSQTPRIGLLSGAELVIGDDARIVGAGLIRRESLFPVASGIVNHGLIRADVSQFSLTVGQLRDFVNYGSVEAVNGSTLSLNAENVVNYGHFLASPGSTVSITADSFENNGMVIADGAKVSFNASLGAADFQRIRAVDGLIEMRGDWSLAGETVELNISHGGLDFRGMVRDGSIALSDGVVMRSSGWFASLRNIHISGGDVVVPKETDLNLEGGVTLLGGKIRLVGEKSTLNVGNEVESGVFLLEGAAVVFERSDAPETGSRYVVASSFFQPKSSSTLVIGSDSSISGLFGEIGRGQTTGPNATVINHGLIDVSAAEVGRTRLYGGLIQNHGHMRVGGVGAQNTLQLIGDSMDNFGQLSAFEDGILRIESGLINYGAVTAHAGGEVLISGGEFMNHGVILSDGGVVVISGPTLMAHQLGDIRQGDGEIKLGGRIENAGGTLRFTEQTGSWTLGARIVGGEILYEDGLSIRLSSATLEDVSVRGSSGMGMTTGFFVRGNVDFGGASISASGMAPEILLFSDARLDDVRLFAEAPGSRMNVMYVGAHSLHLGENAEIRGGVQFTGNVGGALDLHNEGLIGFSSPGETLRLEGIRLANTGLIEIGRDTRLEFLGSVWTDLVDGTLTQGSWRVLEGGSVFSLGSPITITRNAADIEVHGEWTFFDPLTAAGENLGRIAAFNGAFLPLTGAEAAQGAFVNRGEMAAGVGSTIFVFSNFIADADAMLHFQLAGSVESGLGGRLDVFGDAQLGGELIVMLTDDFVGSFGDVWTVVSAASIHGAFDSFTLESTRGRLALDVVYTDTSVELHVIPAPGAGAVLGVCGLCFASRRRTRR